MKKEGNNIPKHHYDRRMGKDDRLSEKIREDREQKEKNARSQRWLKVFFWCAFAVLLGLLVWQGVGIVQEYLKNNPSQLSVGLWLD